MVKKIVILFTMAVMLVSLAACGKKQGGADNAGDGETGFKGKNICDTT